MLSSSAVMGKRKNKNNSSSASSSAAPQTKTKSTTAIPTNLLLAPTPHYKFGKIQCLSPGTVWIQTNFFAAAECQTWIDWTHNDNAWEYTAQRATRYIAHRECFRIQRNDNGVAHAIFGRLQQSGLLAVLQRELSFAEHDDDSYQAVACNPNIRLYQYGKNMSFGKHIDGSNETVVGQTEITLLVYLSQCQGGATRFYPALDGKKDASFCFAPQVGAVLLHVHGDRCLEHEADPVISGTKYVLRSDVCYRRI